MLLLGLAGHAQAEVSASIAVTSNNVWRGVTQTDDGPALQGSVDYAHPNGFYAGTWLSNIDWGQGYDTGVEIDLYGGYAGESGDFGYDMGVLYYHFPTSGYEDSDFTELYLAGSYKWFSAGLSYTLDGDAANDEPFSKGDLYYHVGASFDLEAGWSIGGTIGRYDFDVPAAAGDFDYNHYQLDIGKHVGDFGDLTLSLSKADKASGDDEAKLFLMWSKTFY
jgi:uncharacterized protein (TIGR02001 family)